MRTNLGCWAAVLLAACANAGMDGAQVGGGADAAATTVSDASANATADARELPDRAALPDALVVDGMVPVDANHGADVAPAPPDAALGNPVDARLPDAALIQPADAHVPPDAPPPDAHVQPDAPPPADAPPPHPDAAPPMSDAPPPPDAAPPPDMMSPPDAPPPPDAAPPDATPPEPDAGPLIYGAVPAAGWRIIFDDEFDGRPCDPAADQCGRGDYAARIAGCYGSGASAAPTNLQHKFHAAPADTVRAVEDHLLDLDKCVWSVNNHVNYIHFTGDQHQYLIQTYEPAMIHVVNGELLVGTRFAHGAGPCGSNADPENPDGQDCPYFGGAMTTIPFNGAAQAFPKSSGPYQPGDGLIMPPSGRLEIRAKMPYENGNMAALWTWSAPGGPFEHEHDILEYFMNWREAHHQGEVQYHNGQSSEHGAWVISGSGNDDRYHQFHVYAVEWLKGSYLRYLFDGQEVAKVLQDDLVLSNGNVCWSEEVNGNPFYLIFWNLMTTYWYAPEAAPYGAGQQPDWLQVDWVRLYQTCAVGDAGCIEQPNAGVCQDPCGGYGAWTGSSCYVGQAPGGAPAAIIDGQYAYTGTRACPYGGTPQANGCVLGYPPPGRTPLAQVYSYYVAPLCAPGEGIWNCARPCPWSATVADKNGCYYGAPPAGRAGFVYANNFYYEPASSGPPCPDGGSFDGAHCYLVSAPANLVAVMIDGKYYVEPDHCAYGGTWDPAQQACLFHIAPGGRTSFVYEGNAYYTPDHGQCDTDASYDGANCFVGPLPAGADPSAETNHIWLRATCGAVNPFAGAGLSADYMTCSNAAPALSHF